MEEVPKTQVAEPLLIEQVDTERLPPPKVHIPCSPGFVMLGNSTLLVLVGAAIGEWLPDWSIVSAAAILGGAGWYLMRQRQRAGRERFAALRCRELAAEAPEGAFARAAAAEEAKTCLSYERPVRALALPTLALSAVVALLILSDAVAVLAEWPGAVRLSGGLAAGAASQAALFSLWRVANCMPKVPTFDFAALRRDQKIEEGFARRDRNDLQIIERRTELESLHRRIESYTIESALLSALSFSAFITVSLAGNGNIEDLQRLFPVAAEWHALPERIAAAGVGGPTSYPLPAAGYVASNLVGLICLCLLFCATTFLGVLVARLRFNDGYRDAETLLRTAQCLDDKEDARSGDSDPEWAAHLADSIDDSLAKADALKSGLDIIVGFMRISRGAGILFFVAALALCGLFFSSAVSVLVVALFAIALLAGYIDHFRRALLRTEVYSRAGVTSLLRPSAGRRRWSLFA